MRLLTVSSSAERVRAMSSLSARLAPTRLGLVVEGGEDLVGVLFRVVKSQAAAP